MDGILWFEDRTNDVIVIDELPKTATGKVQKHTLPADVAQRRLLDDGRAPAQP